MSVLPFVLASMQLLAPARDHSSLAAAIASRVDAEAPLFAGDLDKHKTASVVVAVAFRESSFRNDVRSATNDHCALQVHARPELARDPDACVAEGLRLLRESVRACPRYPIAVYASGPSGCSNVRAQRISNDRMWLAGRLVREVVAFGGDAPLFLWPHTEHRLLADRPRYGADCYDAAVALIAVRP